MSDRRLGRTRLQPLDAGFSIVEMLVVLAFIGTIAAIALPILSGAIASMRLNGAIRSIANDSALTKTKAAADFTRSRLYVDLGANSYHRETWVPGAPGAWVADGGPTLLPANVTFNFAPVGTPPVNTQPTPPGIQQAPQCMNSASPPAAIGNTACVVFNSRGIPIDNNGVPTNLDAVYITDGTAVKAMTVTSTGLIGVWSAPPVAAYNWTIS